MVRWQPAIMSSLNSWCVEVYAEDGNTYDAQGNMLLDANGNPIPNGLARPVLRVRYFNVSTIVRHVRVVDGNRDNTYELPITPDRTWVEIVVPIGQQGDLRTCMTSAW